MASCPPVVGGVAALQVEDAQDKPQKGSDLKNVLALDLAVNLSSNLLRNLSNNPTSFRQNKPTAVGPSSHGKELMTSSNDKSDKAAAEIFPFLELPLELREKIYKEAFADGIFCMCENATTKPEKAPDALSLLSTCRLVYIEVQPYLYTSMTLCANVQHAEGLRQLANIKPQAIHRIRHLNLNINYHNKPRDGSCSTSTPTMTYDAIRPWDNMLSALVYDRLSLETLRVDFSCNKHEENCHHDQALLVASLRRLDGCRFVEFTGEIDYAQADSVDHYVKIWLVDEGLEFLWVSETSTATLLNANYRRRWDRLQTAQKAIREGTFEETNYRSHILVEGTDLPVGEMRWKHDFYADWRAEMAETRLADASPLFANGIEWGTTTRRRELFRGRVRRSVYG